MTIEEFEAEIEKINGKGLLFVITYFSVYKVKSIKVETNSNDLYCVRETFNEAFKEMLNLLELKCK